MASKEDNTVCFYEYLKSFAATNVKKYNSCAGFLDFQKNLVLTENQDYYKSYPEKN